MNQACYNLTKCICVCLLIVQLLIFIYLVATSGRKHILFRQDDSLSMDDRRNVNFTKYLLIQLTVMQVLHTIFFIYVIMKNKTIGILLAIICILIQMIAKLTI